MTRVIVFSKDRPAQLDLLLRSMERNAPVLTDDIHIIWRVQGRQLLHAVRCTRYRAGYQTCRRDWPSLHWHEQTAFDEDVLQLLIDAAARPDEKLVFLTDDSVFFRSLGGGDPAVILDQEDRVLCVSLRLGRNTTESYMYRRAQSVPRFSERDGYVMWRWRDADGDFGYPGSLDGHVFRAAELLRLLRDGSKWANPNQLEVELSRRIGAATTHPLMAAYRESVLVGVPVNRTSEVCRENRAAETYRLQPARLNAVYLKGQRLRIESIDPARVNAVHAEFELDESRPPWWIVSGTRGRRVLMPLRSRLRTRTRLRALARRTIALSRRPRVPH
jgi:hypothetical protein